MAWAAWDRAESDLGLYMLQGAHETTARRRARPYLLPIRQERGQIKYFAYSIWCSVRLPRGIVA